MGGAAENLTTQVTLPWGSYQVVKADDWANKRICDTHWTDRITQGCVNGNSDVESGFIKKYQTNMQFNIKS